MANFILDQKGRLLTTVFPTFRGDGALGGPEIMEVTVDLSQIGSANTLAQLGTQSGLPNAGLGLAAADTVDVAVLPNNSVVRAAQFFLDTTQVTPDVIATPYQAGPLTVATINIGDQAVLATDRQTAQTPAGYTTSATRIAGAQSFLTAQNALLAVTGVLYPRPYYVAPASDYVYVVRVAIATLTGAANVKAGKFRIRLALDVYGNV